VLVEGEAHLRDPLMPPPQILKPNPTAKPPSPDDVTDFPPYKTIPIPESITYREGKYRPPSLPFISGTSLPSQVTSPTTHICSKARSTPGARAD
jgi:CDGSH iron-sulfur domain-containing protein 3